MESRWYLPRGRTLADTKIEDRGHALHATAKAWSKITAHLDRNRLIAEAAAKEKAKREAMRAGSKAMTDSWDNSVENVRSRKEEERLQRIKKSEEEKNERFFVMRKEQQEIRQKFIDDARKAMYTSKGFPKDLDSALIVSEVFYEREKQKEFKEKIKEHEHEESLKYAKKVKEGVKEELLEKIETEKKLHKKKMVMKKIYLDKIRENEETERLVKEQQIQEEQIDNIKAKDEMEYIEVFSREEERKKRADVKREFIASYAIQEKIKEQLKREDEQCDQIIELHTKAKQRIECRRKQKLQQMQDEMNVRRELAAKKVMADRQSQAADEERRYLAAVEEVERAEIKKLEVKARYAARLKKEREEYHSLCIEREKIKKKKDEEWKKWEMLNRYKKDEVTRKYDEEKKFKDWQSVLQYREVLFEQMAENEEQTQKENDYKVAYHKHLVDKWSEEDRQFFAYADEVLELAKSRGRSTYPIERVIEQYCKVNNLKLPDNGQSNEPVNNKNQSELVNSNPGKMAHDPNTDPTYNRCPCYTDTLYK